MSDYLADEKVGHGELLVAVGFGLQPLDHGRSVIQTLLIGVCGGSLGFNPQFARLAVQFCLMSGPERRLIAAPGSGDSDYGEHHGLRDLQYFVSQRLRRFFVLAEMVGNFDVGTSSFGHWLRQRYWPNFRKVLPAKMAALYEQVERRTQMLIDVQLASVIPLVQP